MLAISVIMFAIAAALGLVLITAILKNKKPTRGAVIGHGLFAATGLTLVIIYTINNPDNSPDISLVLLIVAALGGFILLARDLSGKPGLKGLAVIHASAAVFAFACFYFRYFRNGLINDNTEKV
ncbi:MAG: hypothetical protein R6W90_18730 [Ignavibacteriaceae bacterium]